MGFRLVNDFVFQARKKYILYTGRYKRDERSLAYLKVLCNANYGQQQ